MMATITETVEDAGEVALATTKAFGRTVLYGAVPLFEFGALVFITVAIVRLPIILLRRLD